MNGHQTWLKNHFCKNCQVYGGVLAKFNKRNGPDKRFKLVPSAYLLERNHFEPQNK